jgi:ribonuclease D
MAQQLRHENYTWIETDQGLIDLVDILCQQVSVAVDTESDSLYSYYEKVCLVQFSLPETDYLVDPLAADIRPLARLFASHKVQKIFHAAEYDILSLKRDYRFEFNDLFDTMIAARILGWPKYGLGDIMEEHFQLNLNKKFQRYNWGLRPLSREANTYARLDTHFLQALCDIQTKQLADVRRLPEAQDAFERLAQVEPSPRSFSAADFWRIKGARKLTPPARAVLQALYVFRDEQARRLDRPLFKVFADSTLVRLANAQPRSLDELAAVKGIGEVHLRRFGRAVLRTIRAAQDAPAPTPQRHTSRRPTEAVRQRYNSLRRWRNDVAWERGVEPDVILANSTLMTISERRPTSLEQLDALDLLGTWQFETYGPIILKILES